MHLHHPPCRKAAAALIEAGADVKAPGKDAWTALHCAALNAQSKLEAVELIELLLSNGADAR
jgi:ankyrin repeat protein